MVPAFAVLLILTLVGFVRGEYGAFMAVLSDLDVSGYTEDPSWPGKSCSLDPKQPFPTVSITISAMKNTRARIQGYKVAEVKFIRGENVDAKRLARYSMRYGNENVPEFLPAVCRSIRFKQISADKVVVGLFRNERDIRTNEYKCNTVTYSITADDRVKGEPLENINCAILEKDYKIFGHLTNANDKP